jgi:hypothetical protein
MDAGWTTDDLCLIAAMVGDFCFSTLTTSSIDPTNHLFFTGGFFLGVTRPLLETHPFVLSILRAEN